MAYRAIVKWRGVKHPSQKHKHAGKGLNSDRFPATNQLYKKPARGSKVVVKYDNKRLADLRNINTSTGFWNIRRIGGFLFNQRGPNKKWASKWTKLLGVQARIPYPLKPGEYAIGEGIVSDGAIVEVVEERGKWCRLKVGTIVRLHEVEHKTGKMYATGLLFRVYGDDKTGEAWIEKVMLERL